MIYIIYIYVYVYNNYDYDYDAFFLRVFDKLRFGVVWLSDASSRSCKNMCISESILDNLLVKQLCLVEMSLNQKSHPPWLNHAQPPGSFTSRYISSSSTDAPQLLPELTPLVDGDTRQSFLWRPSGWSSRSHSNCSVSGVVIITFIYIYNMLWPHLCLVLLGLQGVGIWTWCTKKYWTWWELERDPSFHPSFPFFLTRALCQCEAEFSDESVTRLDLFSCQLVLCRSSERCEAQYNFLSNEAVRI